MQQRREMNRKLLIIGIVVLSLAVAASVSFYGQRQQELKRTASLRQKIDAITAETIASTKKITQEKKRKQQRLQQRK